MMNSNLEMIAQLMKGRDPQEAAMQLIKSRNINDPNINQLIEYAKTNQTDNFVNLATQLFKQRGLDLNQEFQSFMKLLK